MFGLVQLGPDLQIPMSLDSLVMAHEEDNAGDTYQVQCNAFDRVGLGLGEPLLHTQEASPGRDVVDQKDAMSSPIETRRERPEPFLSCLWFILFSIFYSCKSMNQSWADIPYQKASAGTACL